MKARAFSVLELLNLLRTKYGDGLEQELERAMEFAAITSVDDDVETKQAVQKVGNKTIYNGIETKLSQLAEEGYTVEAISNFSALWKVLSIKDQDNSKFRISFAKSGSGFYDDSKGGRGKNQLIYTENPSKKTSGIKFWFKSNTGLVNKCYENYAAKYNLAEKRELFYISKDSKDLIFESSLFEVLGKEKYQNLLTDIANEIN